MRHARPEAGARARSDRYYELGQMSSRELEQVFVRGQSPDLDSLVGWEFCGMNRPGWAKLAGIKKFIKGFYRRAGEVYGYNIPVKQNRVEEPWIAKPSDEAPKRFGFFRVAPVDATARDNAYLHAVLLDYGRGGNKIYDPSRNLRDYLVQVDPDNPDLYLGKAYYRLGPIAPATNFFILERRRQAPTEL